MLAATPTPSISHSPATGIHQATLSLFPPLDSVLKMFGYQWIITQSHLQATLTGHRMPTLPKLRASMDQAPKYSKDRHHKYLVQDFGTHRVFISIDVFMEHIIPGKWKEAWGLAGALEVGSILELW